MAAKTFPCFVAGSPRIATIDRARAELTLAAAGPGAAAPEGGLRPSRDGTLPEVVGQVCEGGGVSAVPASRPTPVAPEFPFLAGR